MQGSVPYIKVFNVKVPWHYIFRSLSETKPFFKVNFYYNGNPLRCYSEEVTESGISDFYIHEFDIYKENYKNKK